MKSDHLLVLQKELMGIYLYRSQQKLRKNNRGRVLQLEILIIYLLSQEMLALIHRKVLQIRERLETRLRGAKYKIPQEVLNELRTWNCFFQYSCD